MSVPFTRRSLIISPRASLYWVPARDPSAFFISKSDPDPSFSVTPTRHYD